MAKKGEKKHLKRLNSPKVRKTPRKEKKWAMSSSSGPHPAEESVPLAVSLRESLSIVRNKREANKILGEGEVQVDGVVRRDSKFPIGLLDVVKILKTGQAWRVFHDQRGHFKFHEVEEDESDSKLVKVVGKHQFKDDEIQLSFHDGKTIVGEYGEVEVDDTLKVSLPELEVLEHISCGKGNLALITGGRNVSKVGNIEDIYVIEGPSSNRFLIKTDDEEFQSPEEYIFIVGEEKPEVSIPEVVE